MPEVDALGGQRGLAEPSQALDQRGRAHGLGRVVLRRPAGQSAEVEPGQGRAAADEAEAELEIPPLVDEQWLGPRCAPAKLRATPQGGH